MLTQSPSAVPSAQSRTWSIAAFAAEAADDAPRASMIAAPRFATVGMNVLLDPGVVADELVGVLAVDLAVEEVGVLRRRVVAPDRHPPHARDRHADALRELAHGAVVIEPRHRGDLARIEVGGVVERDQRVRVGRVADHEHACTSRLALRDSAAPCAVKIAPLADSRSLRSMPCLRGIAPTSSA